MAARTLALSILLVATAAGCMEELFSYFRDVEAPLEDVIPAAEDTARAWRAGATLVGAAGFEAAGDRAEREFTNVSLPPDPDVGNGKAVAWAFEYVDPATGDQLGLLIASENRTVVLREEEAADEDANLSGFAGFSWRVRSDEAMGIAKANASFAAAAANLTNPIYMEALGDRGMADRDDAASPGPHWALVAFADNGGAMAIVNATSGELVYAGAFPDFGLGGSWGGDWDFSGLAPPEAYYEDSFEGELTLLSTEAEHEVPVAEDGLTVKLEACFGQRAPLGGVRLALLDEAGEVVDEQSGGFGGRFLTLEVSDLPEGTYAARLSLEQPGVAVDYVLHVWVGKPGFEIEFDWTEYAMCA